MPFFASTVSVPANGTLENVLSGSQWEFAPYDCSLEFAVVGAATGLVGDISTGADVVAEGFTVSNANRYPVLPDDFHIFDVTRSGERIKCRVRNTTAGAVNVTVCMRMSPVRGR
jgi:hypothetical protein